MQVLDICPFKIVGGHSGLIERGDQLREQERSPPVNKESKHCCTTPNGVALSATSQWATATRASSDLAIATAALSAADLPLPGGASMMASWGRSALVFTPRRRHRCRQSYE